MPSTLGYYDLRNASVMESQSELARQNNVSGFAMYLYWFGNGEVALREPIERFLEAKHINSEYFLCWANGDWTKSWVGEDHIKIFTQRYDETEFRIFFMNLAKYFLDSRYVKVDNRPVFYVHAPSAFRFQKLKEHGDAIAKELGFDGLCWVAPLRHVQSKDLGLLDYLLGYPPGDMNLTTGSSNTITNAFSPLAVLRKSIRGLRAPNSLLFKSLSTYDYNRYCSKYERHMLKMSEQHNNYIPCTIPNWDNTPRYGARGFLFRSSTPERFMESHRYALAIARKKKLPFILTKAWNEWAEGNYLEPDERCGDEYLKAIAESYNDAPVRDRRANGK